MEDILKLAERNQAKAWQVVREAKIVEVWESIGAEIHLVGSLSMGLLMTHRDIDFHIYSPSLKVYDSFAAMARLAENPSIKRVEFVNLTDTNERCIEWHAWYVDDEGETWQLDMIHILKGSFYDGYFERVAGRISAVLTPETREVILRLKYETPETEKVMGIEYYQAVIRDGIRDYAAFMEWRKEHPVRGIVEWRP